MSELRRFWIITGMYSMMELIFVLMLSNRLRVPKYNAILEFLNFAMLMLSFCLCLSRKEFLRILCMMQLLISPVDQDLDHLGPWEMIFMVFAAGFILDEYAQAKEHGWSSECA